MKKKFNIICFGIGLIAVIVMIFTFDVSFAQLWLYIERAGYWLVAILILWTLLYILNTLSWQVILKGSGRCEVGFLKLFRFTISGFALNFSTPMGLLGGEPYKIVALTPYVGAHRASSSVVLFAMMHVFGHIVYWATSIIVYLVLYYLELVPMDGFISVALIFMTIFCSAAIYMFSKGYRYGIIVKLLNVLSHLPFMGRWMNRFIASHNDDLTKIDKEIAALHTQSRRSFWLSMLIEYAGRMLQNLEIYFMLILFGIGDGGILTFFQSYIILSFTSLFANILSFIPMQLAGREGGFAMSVALLGMSADIGIFISIICRVREIFWALIGLAMMTRKS